MTIRTTEAMRIAGVETASSSRLTLAISTEADLVASGRATMLGPNALSVPRARREWVAPRSRVVKRGTSLNRVVTANSGTAATTTVDTAAPFGRTALKVAIPSGNTWTEVGYNDLNVPSFEGHVAYRIWIEDYTKISDIKLYVGNSGYALNSLYTETVSTSNAFLINGERVLYVGPQRINSGGTFVFGSTTLANTKVRITPVAAAATNVWIEAIELPDPAPAMIALTFDDASVSFMTVLRPILGRYGVRATFNINTGDVGTNAALYVTSAQVRQLSADGHQITCHNVSNLKYTASPYSGDQTLSQYMADYTTARKTLEGYGLPADGFMYHSYVQGGVDEALVVELKSEGVRCARLAAQPKIVQYGAGIGAEVMALRTYELGTNYATSIVVDGVNDLAQYGGLMMIMAHEIITSGTPTGVQVLASDLETVLSRAKAYGIEFVTMREAYERLYLAESLSRPIGAL